MPPRRGPERSKRLGVAPSPHAVGQYLVTIWNSSGPCSASSLVTTGRNSRMSDFFRTLALFATLVSSEQVAVRHSKPPVAVRPERRRCERRRPDTREPRRCRLSLGRGYRLRGMLPQSRPGLRAALAATAVAGAALTGCGARISASSSPPHRSAGYKVLTGDVSMPLLGSAGLASGQWPQVPSSAGKWWAVSSPAATFTRTETVDLLATGTPGVRFHLGWEETCGGKRMGKHGVVGGSGGEGNLTLKAPALVLIRLPPPEGNLEGCYLATTIFLHTKTFHDAKAAAPRVQIIHY